jgi:hypothetical protein
MPAEQLGAASEPDRFTALPADQTVADTVVALEEHGFSVEVVDDLDGARQAVLARIPDGSPVMTNTSADEETAARLHGTAAGSYPFVKKLKPTDFVRLLAVAEITLGSALLLPVIPPAVAGAGLAAFSGGLPGLYARTPGMRKKRSPFPSQQGTPLAKDVWMAGIGLGLVIDDLTDRPGKGG